MKRRGFFKLLGAAAAAPVVAKAAEPAFTEADYLFAVDRDNPTPTIDPEPLSRAWLTAEKPPVGVRLVVEGQEDEWLFADITWIGPKEARVCTNGMGSAHAQALESEGVTVHRFVRMRGKEIDA